MTVAVQFLSVCLAHIWGGSCVAYRVLSKRFCACDLCWACSNRHQGAQAAATAETQTAAPAAWTHLQCGWQRLLQVPVVAHSGRLVNTHHVIVVSGGRVSRATTCGSMKWVLVSSTFCRE